MSGGGGSGGGPDQSYYDEQLRMQREQIEMQKEQIRQQEEAAAAQKKATDEQDAISRQFADQQRQYLGRATGNGGITGDLRAQALLEDTRTPIGRRSLLGVG